MQLGKGLGLNVLFVTCSARASGTCPSLSSWWASSVSMPAPRAVSARRGYRPEPASPPPRPQRIKPTKTQSRISDTLFRAWRWQIIINSGYMEHGCIKRVKQRVEDCSNKIMMDWQQENWYGTVLNKRSLECLFLLWTSNRTIGWVDF